MNALEPGEARSVRAALDAADPGFALRDAVRHILGERLLDRATLITVLDELADEYRAAGRAEHVAVIADVLDVLEGQGSDYAFASYFEGLPRDVLPRPRGAA